MTKKKEKTPKSIDDDDDEERRLNDGVASDDLASKIRLHLDKENLDSETLERRKADVPHLMLAHALAGIFYAITAIVSMVLLGRGAGTSVEVGYTFGTIVTTGPNNDVTFEISLSSDSRVVAEAMVPVYCTLSAFYHLAVVGMFKRFKEQWLYIGWNPLNALKQVIIQPLFVVQLFILCRIADVEKMTFIYFVALYMSIFDGLVEVAAHSSHFVLGKLEEQGELLQQLPAPNRPQKWYRRTRVVMWSIYGVNTAIWSGMWIIAWTNVSWQTSHHNTPSYTFAVFVLVFVQAIAVRVYGFQLISKQIFAEKWTELFEIIMPLILAACFSYISLPATS